MTGCYDELVDAGVRTRFAATLTGLSKATQDRRRRARCMSFQANRALARSR